MPAGLPQAKAQDVTRADPTFSTGPSEAGLVHEKYGIHYSLVETDISQVIEYA